MKKVNKIGNKLVIISLLLSLIPTLVYAKEDNFTININKKPIQMDKDIGYPFINEYNRTMIPIRIVSENMGYNVGWDKNTKVVTLKNNDKTICLEIGKDYSIINGREVKLDSEKSNTKVEIVNNRTYVPLRFISEELGYSVDHNQLNGKHIIDINKDKEHNLLDNVDKITDIKDSNTFLRPKGYDYAGPIYGFDRNNIKLKDITDYKDRLNLEYLKPYSVDNLRIYDGTDLYPINSNIEYYFTFENEEEFIDFGLYLFNISNSEDEGYKKDELARFVVSYFELEDGESVQGSNYAIKGLKVSDNSPYNLIGHRITKVVMVNEFNRNEILVINTNIQLPNKLEGLREFKIDSDYMLIYPSSMSISGSRIRTEPNCTDLVTYQ